MGKGSVGNRYGHQLRKSNQDDTRTAEKNQVSSLTLWLRKQYTNITKDRETKNEEIIT